jgi:hypothetical protein
MATDDPILLTGFRRIADWFVDEAVEHPTGLAWLYRFPWLGGQPIPWYSAISQAHGISVLIRAAATFGDDRYSEVAYRAAELMISRLDLGGCAVEWPDRTISLEESRRAPASAILNGHLFAVYAAWEAWRFFSAPHFFETAERGWSFVASRRRLYDLGVWSRYSLRMHRLGMVDVASPHYHGVHVAQLRVAAAITSDRVLSDMSDRFDEYQWSPALRRNALRKRVMIKLLN